MALKTVPKAPSPRTLIILYFYIHYNKSLNHKAFLTFFEDQHSTTYWLDDTVNFVEVQL